MFNKPFSLKKMLLKRHVTLATNTSYNSNITVPCASYYESYLLRCGISDSTHFTCYVTFNVDIQCANTQTVAIYPLVNTK